MDILIGRPGSNPLVRDYVAGNEGCRPFFARGWRGLEGYRVRAEAIRAEARDAGWAEAVSTASEPAREKLQAVIDGDGFVVTTGQQPGLFGGPLYAVWKGLSAIRLAATLEEALEVPVLPLFWVASEDHDWEETDHAHLVGVDNELHRIALPAVEGAGDAPLFRLPIDGVAWAAIDQAAELLPDTEVARETIDRLSAAYRSPGATLATGFQSLLEGLLGPLGLAFVQADAPELKRRSRPILEASWRRAEEIETELRERAEALEAAGYPVQVPILEGGVNLFVESEGHRERLYRDGDDFVMRHSGQRFTPEALESMAESAIDRLTPNVHLRPMVEAHVFPTLAYVAGPGELTYFAQLDPLYRALGVAAPVIYPRHGVTLIETKIGKVLAKHEIEIDTLARPFHEIAQDFARDEVPEGVRAALGKIRGAIGQGSGELTEAARAIDPTLKGPIGSARGAAFAAFADAEKAILRAVKRESEITLQQIEKARLHLFPEATPQERTMSIVYYLARYGAHFLHDVLAEMDPALQASMAEG